MFLKRNLLLIVFVSSLIGFSETWIGSMDLPFRSVVLSSITLTLLALARSYLPKTGTSLLIVIVAILFKVNSYGIQSYCTASAILCGPTALLLLGMGFEIFAFLFIDKNPFKSLNYVLCCIGAALFVFITFGLMNTFILKSWDTSRLQEYILLKGSLTAIASSILSLGGWYLLKYIKTLSFPRLHPYFMNVLLGSVVLSLWICGYYIA